jgi:hypothetical protein
MSAQFDSNDLYYLYKTFLILRPVVLAIFSVYYSIIIIKKSLNNIE